MSLIRGYDPDTLREVVDIAAAQTRLGEIGMQRSLPAMFERVWLLKVLGRLDDALILSEESVRVTRMAGRRQDVLRARVLHASVMQFRGAYFAASRELAAAAGEAERQRWSGIAAFAYRHAGRNAFESGDFASAREHFARALFLEGQAGATDAELERTLHSIAAAEQHAASVTVIVDAP